LFVYIKGIFSALLRWKMKNNNSDAQQIQTLEQTVSHCDEEFYPNISTILQLLLTPPVGSCPCERSFSSLRRLKRGCQWGIAIVSKQLKKRSLVSKQLKKRYLVSKQQKNCLVS